MLRGVSLNTQPQPLQRRVAGGCGMDSDTSSPDSPGSGESPEDAYARGRAEGFAAGQAAAAQEDRLRLESSLEAVRRQAFEVAQREGLEQGLAQASARLQEALREQQACIEEESRQHRARFAALVDGLASEAGRWRAGLEDELVALIHEAICRILASQAARPEVLLAMVRGLLREHGERASLAVHLHPQDHALVARCALPGDGAQWQWLADPAVRLGGVMLRSPEGNLDARLETQLEALGHALLAARARLQQLGGEGA